MCQGFCSWGWGLFAQVSEGAGFAGLAGRGCRGARGWAVLQLDCFTAWRGGSISKGYP